MISFIITSNQGADYTLNTTEILPSLIQRVIYTSEPIINHPKPCPKTVEIEQLEQY